MAPHRRYPNQAYLLVTARVEVMVRENDNMDEYDNKAGTIRRKTKKEGERTIDYADTNRLRKKNVW